MSIEISKRLFDGPHLIKNWDPLNFPAIYAIMMKPDLKIIPRDIRLCIYANLVNYLEKNHI